MRKKKRQWEEQEHLMQKKVKVCFVNEDKTLQYIYTPKQLTEEIKRVKQWKSHTCFDNEKNYSTIMLQESQQGEKTWIINEMLE